MMKIVHNIPDLVDILERKAERFVGWTTWWLNSIDGLQEGLARALSGLGFLIPTLVPWAVGGVVDHVVTIETGDRNKRNGLRVESDLLDEVGGFLDNFVVTSFRPLSGVLESC